MPDNPAGMRWTLQHGGGWLYDATSPAASAAALVAAARDREVLLAKRREALALSGKLFSPDVAHAQFLQLEEALLHLRHNGEVLDLRSAPRFRAVGVPAYLRRLLTKLTGPRSRLMRRPDIPVLTTLRFPAAFAIVLFHFLVYTPCPQWIWEGFGSGVAFFYVLSGFILYYNYADLADRGFFWLARFARIWPVHLFCLALTFGLIPFRSLDGHASWPTTLPANILLLHAWLPFQGSVLSFNGVSWSLSVEAFFYLCFPWLLSAMKSRGPAPLLAGSFVLALVVVLFSVIFLPRQAAFVWPFNPATRLFEFVLGMATCRWWMRERAGTPSGAAWTGYELASFAAAVGSVVAVPVLLHALGIASVVASWLGSEFPVAAFAAMIWIFAHQAGAISRALSHRACEWFGEVSFALYMCHQILLRWLDPAVMTNAPDAVAFFLPYVLGAMLVAAAIFHLIETPARRAIVSAWKRRA